jgi:hypothetical protein
MNRLAIRVNHAECGVEVITRRLLMSALSVAYCLSAANHAIAQPRVADPPRQILKGHLTREMMTPALAGSRQRLR